MRDNNILRWQWPKGHSRNRISGVLVYREEKQLWNDRKWLDKSLKTKLEYTHHRDQHSSIYLIFSLNQSVDTGTMNRQHRSFYELGGGGSPSFIETATKNTEPNLKALPFHFNPDSVPHDNMWGAKSSNLNGSLLFKLCFMLPRESYREQKAAMV